MTVLTEAQKLWIERKLQEFQENEFRKRNEAVKQYKKGELKSYLRERRQSVYLKLQKLAETEEFTEEELTSIVNEAVEREARVLEGRYIANLNDLIECETKKYSRELIKKMEEVLS